MKARARAIWRLLAVQAAWTYERMSGIGAGHAAAPLLAEAHAPTAAIARSATFFNSHPYLAGVVVGATVRAERDEVAGEVVLRLRAALSGPLGAIGDQLVWAGEVPALMGLTLVLSLWLGWWSVVLALVIHNVLRLRLTIWSLDVGLRDGLGVGAALQRSWLPRAAAIAQRAAGFLVGLAIPVVGWRLLRNAPLPTITVTVIVAVLGAALSLAVATRTRATGLRLGLMLMGAAVLAAGVMP
ncbi:MAG TPA: PTS system mannose/fructose/sorbose family transporter subunit IID [Gemmatimonadales bacterium]|nr:PTS system mannose/fructose/sorbose family transporter subunit IID [Gemmatimonadales bacterium]